LRVLSLSRLDQPTLSPENFAEFGTDLEELEVTYGGLQTIKNNAFKHVHGLKRLKLADNKIANMESDAFVDVSNTFYHVSFVCCIYSRSGIRWCR
jgi:hypothetical protein